jgi:hypothetical protein
MLTWKQLTIPTSLIYLLDSVPKTYISISGDNRSTLDGFTVVGLRTAKSPGSESKV